MKVARADPQLSLLDTKPIYKVGTNALNRNAYGFAAQEIVCAALCLTPIRINGNCSICFDAERDGTFFEVKSVRHGHKIVIYQWRLEKEVNCGENVRYAVLARKCGRSSTNDLINHFASNHLELILSDLVTVQSVAEASPLRTLIKQTPENKRNGYNRAGYVRGYYNVPYADLRSATQYYGLRLFQLHGVDFRVALRKTNAG